MRSGLAFVVTCLFASVVAHARNCPDGEHPQIDVREVSLKYEASGLEATLSGLGVLGAQLTVSPKVLQQAAVATQKMNEFIKALVLGYNACAVSKAEYQEALERLLPGLQGDAGQLEQFRRRLIADQAVDRERFNQIFSRYEHSLKRFAALSGRELDYERIEAVVDERVRAHVQAGTARVLEGQAEILRRFNELERRASAAPLPTPQEIDKKITALQAQLAAASERAETEYQEGYRLFERFRFRDALPHLQRAAEAVPLAEIYLALGRAQEEIGASADAERAFRSGIQRARSAKDTETEARLTASLALLIMNTATRDRLFAARLSEAMDMLSTPRRSAWPIALEASAKQGDIRNTMAVALAMFVRVGPAESYATILKYREKAAASHGEEDPQVALYDLLRVTFIVAAQQAPGLRVPSDHRLATDAGQALELARGALAVQEAAFGPVHPRVGFNLSLLGILLSLRKEYDAALAYMRRSLSLAESIYGPESGTVAAELQNTGIIHLRKGDLENAAEYFKRARAMQERLHGPDSMHVHALDLQLDKIRRQQPGQSK